MSDPTPHVRDHYEAGIEDLDDLIRRLDALIPSDATVAGPSMS